MSSLLFTFIVRMRKPLAILLLIVFASTTEAGQLLKLPSLLFHVYDHLQSRRSKNIVAFLYEHYVKDHGKDADQKQDQQLPFKTVYAEQLSFTCLLPVNAMSCAAPVLKTENKKTVYSLFVLNDYLKDIFHPPQLV